MIWSIKLPLATVVSAVVMGFCLTGCADSSQHSAKSDAAEASLLWQEALNVSKGAQTAKVVGRYADGSQAPKTFDIEGRVDGTNQRARVNIGDGVAMDIVVANGYGYLNMDALTKGQFVKRELKDMTEFNRFTVASLLQESTQRIRFDFKQKNATKTDAVDYQGKPAIKLSNTVSRQFVVIDQKSKFILVVDDGNGTDALTFSRWNQIDPIPAPPLTPASTQQP